VNKGRCKDTLKVSVCT